jgi:hypothetical protein
MYTVNCGLGRYNQISAPQPKEPQQQVVGLSTQTHDDAAVDDPNFGGKSADTGYVNYQ